MTRIFKGIFGIFMTLLIMLTSSFSVNAASDYKLLYTVENDGTATITGYEGTPIHLVIPSEIDGYSVSKIGMQAFGTTGESLYHDSNSFCPAETITIEYGISEIEFEAFSNCKNLNAVILPDTLDTIGDAAFCGCDNLYEITIPANSKYIFPYSFGFVCDYIFNFYQDELYDYEAVPKLINNFVIYSEHNTAAEAYANENGLTFIALDESISTTTAQTTQTTSTSTTTTTTISSDNSESTNISTTVTTTLSTTAITSDNQKTTTQTSAQSSTAGTVSNQTINTTQKIDSVSNGNANNSKGSSTSSPKTGDSFPMVSALTAIGISAVSTVLFMKKRK